MKKVIEFEAKAKLLKDKEEVSIWTDGLAVSTDLLPMYSVYRLEDGKKYRVKIEIEEL